MALIILAVMLLLTLLFFSTLYLETIERPLVCNNL